MTGGRFRRPAARANIGTMTRLGLMAALAVAGVGVGAAVAQEDEQNATLVCTNAGVQYSVGEYACIPACRGQRRLARCDTVAERASWTYVDDACPSAMIINPPWPSDWTEVPVVAVMTPIPLVVNLSAIAPDIAPKITRGRVTLAN